jgi:multimeric flavodoxin WrbA
MKALVINCTLKKSPERSNTEALAEVVIDKLKAEDVEVTEVRAVDKDLHPGVETDMGEGDEWPPIHDALLAADILVIATPTWLARPASVTQLIDIGFAEAGRGGEGAGGGVAARAGVELAARAAGFVAG